MTAPRIHRLVLRDFRSYASLAFAPDAAMIALVGENGAGKTNVLESISLMTPGRGLRRAEFDEMSRRGGAGGFAVSIAVDGGMGLARLGTGREAGVDGPVRSVRVDGEPVGSVAAFSDHLRIVWLTPDQDGLFRGPAGDRRRYLDRLTLAIDPGHAARVSAYDKALRQRNRLLEDPSPDARWLAALEAEAASLAIAVAASRAETVQRLAALIAATRDEASPFPWAGVGIDGDVETLLADHSAADAEERFAAVLRDQREADRAAGRALRGPQTSQFSVRHGPKDIPAGDASTGEQKALLIGLTLAHAQLVADMSRLTPIVLLDEVAAHLDPRRRAALYGAVAALGAQAWMTGADPALFEEMPAAGARFLVSPGRVEPMA